MIGTGSRAALLACLLGSVLAESALAQAPPASAPAAAATAARELFVILYRPGPAWRAGRPMAEQDLRPHGAYYRRLTDEGRVFAGGGFVGEDGGLAIVRAATPEEAQAIVAADPAVSSGVFSAEIRQWRPRFHTEGPLVEPAP